MQCTASRNFISFRLKSASKYTEWSTTLHFVAFSPLLVYCQLVMCLDACLAGTSSWCVIYSFKLLTNSALFLYIYIRKPFNIEVEIYNPGKPLAIRNAQIEFSSNCSKG